WLSRDGFCRLLLFSSVRKRMLWLMSLWFTVVSLIWCLWIRPLILAGVASLIARPPTPCPAGRTGHYGVGKCFPLPSGRWTWGIARPTVVDKKVFTWHINITLFCSNVIEPRYWR